MRSEQSLDADSLQQHSNASRLEFASQNLLRFLLLLLNCKDQSLINIGLDITANISPLTTAHISYSDHYVTLLTLIYEWCVNQILISQDLHALNRCLEILAKLVCASYESINRLIISQVLQQKLFFTRLTELLTCQHDVGLLVSCLDCCLSLSENYPKMLLQDNQHLIKIIINLLNCDANTYFTPDGIQRIKVVDERKPVLEPSPLIPQMQNLQPVAKLSSSQSALITENEQFAIQWLHAQYETRTSGSGAPRSILKISDMYNDYFKYNCRCGRKNLISSQAFGQVVKKAFPSICFLVGGEIEGLAIKTTNQATANANKVNQNPLTSPILKAHLSTPPKTASVGNVVTTSAANASLTNGIGSVGTSSNATTLTASNAQVISGATNTSTLIKNMLANKLRTGTTQISLPPGHQMVDSAGNPINFQIVASESGALLNKATIQTTGPIMQKSTIGGNTLMVATPTSGANLITLPVQSGQNIVRNQAGSVLLTTNQLQAGTAKLVPNPQAPHQFLLVRTIMSPQANQMYSVPTSSGSVRLILPASVITKPINSVSVNSAGGTSATNVTPTSTMFALAPTTSNSLNSTTGNILLTSTANAVPIASNTSFFSTSTTSSPVSTALVFTTSSVTGAVSSTAAVPINGIPVSQTPIALTTVSSNVATVTPTLAKALEAKEEDSTDSSSNESKIDNRSSQVKSSPLLNVLLDKGKLPDAFPTSVQPVTTNNNHNNGSDNSLLSNKIEAEKSHENSVQINLKANDTSVLSNDSNTKTISDSISSSTTNDDLTKNDSQSKPVLNNSNNTSGSVLNSDGQVTTKLVNGLPNDKSYPLVNGEQTKSTNVVTTAEETSKRSAEQVDSEDNVADSLPKKSKLEATNVNSVAITAVNSTDSNNSTAKPVIPTINGSIEASASNSKDSPSVSNGTVAIKQEPLVKQPTELEYACEWGDCKRTFSKTNLVFLHVHRDHIIPSPIEQSTCCWGGPEGTGPGCHAIRPKYSLLTHIQDFHCNPQVLHINAMRRQQIALEGITTIQAPAPPPAHPGYANNAAFMAIRRHNVNYIEPTKNQTNHPTSAISTSIRLTAALILRNLAQHSSSIKLHLKSYESLLSELCIFDGRDESRTLAQCLAVITDDS